ncbi:transketolase [Undibacterium sp. 5I1]|uniref:transketolase n=1 Tax=unclassified Undibacterium TaxID=2630295 RepID=UPI002AB40249|nr:MULTISPECIES: transketolase [unclassified Undibacterium]MDY7537403.1 transketolase [Undibacterium sp. 5I1]MEB0232273.1 transketolase [Undibacterium sp. 10I3]MEB0259710.1 transketolase [Undibacterium sp. 5I1]
MNEPEQFAELEIDERCINTLRTLSIDAVQKAQSGHPGTPMGAAPTAYCLWQGFLRYDPDNPEWINRDRFVLSAGHACALLYSLLFLTGVKAKSSSYPPGDRLAVTLEDLKNFRQAGSRCTGHPEFGWTSGVETTTGPLGQGLANSVGMAISERWLAATYNRPSYELFSHHVYALCGDGDMMEGVSSEAASLAGHLKLANLCWIYDDNHISIEGATSITFTENVAARFLAYGWQVLRVKNANNLTALTKAYQIFADPDERGDHQQHTHDANEDRPTLIIVESHIGYGAPHKQDTREAHGEPLGVEEARLTKQFYGCNPDLQFDVPDGVIDHFKKRFGLRGAIAHATWNALYLAYRNEYPDQASEIDKIQVRNLPENWETVLPVFGQDEKGMATRDSSGIVLNALAFKIPWLMGGAADLSPSTKTQLNLLGPSNFQAIGQAAEGNYAGRNFHFGVREHAMCAIANGMSLSGLRPFVSSFLIFTDYCRAALRLSAMMELPLISVWTHDSIGMGEDGPTHQPIEQLASLRAMPGIVVLRPADANEVVEAWRVMMQFKQTPVCLVLTRQAVPTLDRSIYASASGLAFGAYILAETTDNQVDVLLIASGSEVGICIKAYEQLKTEGIHARVISMPSWEIFESQTQAYKDKILPPSIKARVVVEAASTFGWERYAGVDGSILGMHTFGMSAPIKVLLRQFGFEPEHVVASAKVQMILHPTPHRIEAPALKG